MFGLFKQKVTPTLVADSLRDKLLQPVQAHLALFCADAKVNGAENYLLEEAALVCFIGFQSILSAQWEATVRDKVFVAFAVGLESSQFVNGSDQASQFIQKRFNEYRKCFSETKNRQLPMDDAISHFFDVLGVEDGQEMGLRLTLNMQLLGQLTGIVGTLNQLNAKFRII